jgi:hypothetical protein
MILRLSLVNLRKFLSSGSEKASGRIRSNAQWFALKRHLAFRSIEIGG